MCIKKTLLYKTFNNFQKNVGQTEREAATELGFLSYIVLAKMSDLDPKVTKQGKQYHHNYYDHHMIIRRYVAQDCEGVGSAKMWSSILEKNFMLNWVGVENLKMVWNCWDAKWG